MTLIEMRLLHGLTHDVREVPGNEESEGFRAYDFTRREGIKCTFCGALRCPGDTNRVVANREGIVCQKIRVNQCDRARTYLPQLDSQSQAQIRTTVSGWLATCVSLVAWTTLDRFCQRLGYLLPSPFLTRIPAVGVS
jgi:hypothetical protein